MNRPLLSALAFDDSNSPIAWLALAILAALALAITVAGFRSGGKVAGTKTARSSDSRLVTEG